MRQLSYSRRFLILVVAGWVMLNFTSLLRGLTTNTAAISADADDPNFRPLVLSDSIDIVAERIEAWTKTTSIWDVVSKEDVSKEVESQEVLSQEVLSQEVGPERVTMHLTRTTRVFGFVDDIHVTITSADGGCTVTATSQSRIGKGDLGQNPRNLKALIAALK